jgi:hypothetical protein
LTNFAAALWLLKEKYGETDPMKFERLLNDIFNERGISLKPIIAEHKNNNLIEPGVYRLYNKLYRVKGVGQARWRCVWNPRLQVWQQGLYP